MKIVVSLGGNALSSSKKKAVTYSNLSQNIRKAAKSIANVIKYYNDPELIIVFGSGPQIGSLILQNESAKQRVSPMPLHVLDAELQGEVGYIIEQTLINILPKKPVVSVLTQVLVDRNDPAFRKPTKPIGPYYNNKYAALLKTKGFHMAKINGGYRRVVPSPKPLEIIEAESLRKLVKIGAIVIAAGGGGIPVYRKGKKLIGIDAVIDKDMASAVLAKTIKADALFILTDVDSVYLNYNKKDEKAIRKLTAKQAEKYLKAGQFPEGSMGPKVQAAADFVKSGGKKAVITSINRIKQAFMGKAGTVITK